MKKASVLLVIILIVCIAYSCKKRSNDTGEVYSPTAYTLQYPGFVDSYIGAPRAAADNPLTVQGVALGKKLFYDMRLSGNSTMACVSCHAQGHSFDDSTEFSTGIRGQVGTRNAMPLINLAWSDRFFWDGRSGSLEGQAHDPVVNPVEMDARWPVVMQRLQADTAYTRQFFAAFGSHTIDSTLVTKAIAQFERTLIAYNSRFDQSVYLGTKTFSFQQALGRQLFQQSHCTDCHIEGQFTDHAFRNNGLDLEPSDSGLAKFTHNPADYGKFKVPTLRNIALTAPYMHDGRFATLDAVVHFYATGIIFISPNLDTNMQHLVNNAELNIQQQAAIVAFLQTLTDTSFVTNAVFKY